MVKKLKFSEERLKKYEKAGYSWLGESKKRLNISAMPSNEDLKEFAEQICERTGFIIEGIDKINRVVLMIRNKETKTWNNKKIKKQNQMISSKNKI